MKRRYYIVSYFGEDIRKNSYVCRSIYAILKPLEEDNYAILAMMKEKIQHMIEKISRELGVTIDGISVERPSDISHGDYATNIAFLLSKQMKKTPMQIAQEIVAKLHQYQLSKQFASIVAVKPGFINFTIADEQLVKGLKNLIDQNRMFGENKSLKGEVIVVEYTDPNPFKEFHIGHLYSNIVGESLVRLLKSQGAEVVPVCYQGDVGLHVAKSLWGMFQLKADMPDENSSLVEKAGFMGRAYALGTAEYEQNEAVKQEITMLNKKIYDKDPSIKNLYDTGRQWSLDHFDTIYRRLGTRFQKFYFESNQAAAGVAIVEENLNKGIFEKSEGAVIFRGERFGLHTRVFINSLGLPTYEAKDLSLAITKDDDFHYDLSIIVTANEVNEYFKVVKKALSLIRPELSEKTKHVGHAVVRLPGGKMSSRKGNILTGVWLLDEAKKRVQEKIDQQTKETKANTDVVCEVVGIAAVKYALLKANIGKDVEFDFDESISFEGNSGPYIQYSFVRTRSILKKAGEHTATFDIIQDYLPTPSEKELLRILLQFPEVVLQAGVDLAPSTICTYLYLLAKTFNAFYQKQRIINAIGHGEREFRLVLTKAVGITLARGLDLLGIAAPESM